MSDQKENKKKDDSLSISIVTVSGPTTLHSLKQGQSRETEKDSSSVSLSRVTIIPCYADPKNPNSSQINLCFKAQSPDIIKKIKTVFFPDEKLRTVGSSAIDNTLNGKAFFVPLRRPKKEADQKTTSSGFKIRLFHEDLKHFTLYMRNPNIFINIFNAPPFAYPDSAQYKAGELPRVGDNSEMILFSDMFSTSIAHVGERSRSYQIDINEKSLKLPAAGLVSDSNVTEISDQISDQNKEKSNRNDEGEEKEKEHKDTNEKAENNQEVANSAEIVDGVTAPSPSKAKPMESYERKKLPVILDQNKGKLDVNSEIEKKEEEESDGNDKREEKEEKNEGIDEKVPSNQEAINLESITHTSTDDTVQSMEPSSKKESRLINTGGHVITFEKKSSEEGTDKDNSQPEIVAEQNGPSVLDNILHALQVVCITIANGLMIIFFPITLLRLICSEQWLFSIPKKALPEQRQLQKNNQDPPPLQKEDLIIEFEKDYSQYFGLSLLDADKKNKID